MAKRCPICGAENRDAANYCIVCRASLAAAPAPPALWAAAPSPSPAPPAYYPPAPAAALARLVDPGGREHPLQAAQVVVGRSSACDIVLADSAVSGRHAQLSNLGGAFTVEDLGSTNGTFVNGQKVIGVAALSDGDLVQFGPQQAFTFYSSPGPVASGGTSRTQAVSIPTSGIGGATSSPQGALLSGEVVVVDPERQEKAPFDPARAMVLAAAALAMLGLCAAVLPAFIVTIMIMAVVGVSLSCLIPLFFPLFLVSLEPILHWLKGDQTVSVLNFQVRDTGGQQHDAVLYREKGGGNVRQGDKVYLWGDWRRDNTIWAYKVQIYESGGQPAGYSVNGKRPWPLRAGWLALGLVAALWLLAVLGLVLSASSG